MDVKIRKSNFELLRIISMLMIVAHHYAVHGNFHFLNASMTFERAWMQLLMLGGKVGVNIFMLISGYFLINMDKISLAKIFKYWGQVFFYSILLSVVAAIFHWSNGMSLGNIMRALFPLCTNAWWYATAYFVVYLFVPYINKMLKNITKKQHLLLILIMFFLASFMGTFYPAAYDINNTCWLLYLYIIAAYIALYLKDVKFKFIGIFALGVWILTYISAIIFYLIGDRFAALSFVKENATSIFNENSVLILILAVLIFLTFKDIDIKRNSIINIIASATFGVYLIHDNGGVSRFIWGNVFNNSGFEHSKLIVVHSIVAIVVVFSVCAIIDIIRQKTVEKIWMKCVGKICNILQPKLSTILNMINKKI